MCSRQQTLPPGDAIGNLLRKINEADAGFVDGSVLALSARDCQARRHFGGADLTVQFVTRATRRSNSSLGTNGC